MGNKKNFSTEIKLQCIQRFLDGKESAMAIAADIGINDSTLYQWVNNYESLGMDGIRSGVKLYYSEELRKTAVEDYLAENGSLKTICKKYGIRSDSILQRWIFQYNEHKKQTSSFTGGIPIMPLKRITTYEERVEIVRECIKRDLNYQEAAKKYQVTYQQVYSWVKKYKADGAAGLIDRRGKRKAREEMTEVEILHAENKLLREENKRNQAQMLFLKKLEEIERGRS